MFHRKYVKLGTTIPLTVSPEWTVIDFHSKSNKASIRYEFNFIEENEIKDLKKIILKKI